MRCQVRSLCEVRVNVFNCSSNHFSHCLCKYQGTTTTETPLGDLKIDENLRDELLSTNKFGIMEHEVDKEEHLGEMQYPFITKIVNDTNESSSISM